MNDEIKKPEQESVTFIADPSALSLNDVAKAQNMGDNFELDDNLTNEAELEADAPNAQETEAALDRIAGAIAGADEATLQEAQAAAAELVEETSAEHELAAQIAEDQALEAELAQANADEARAAEVDPELEAALPHEPQPQEDGSLDLSEIESCLEAMLYISDKPMSLDRLHDLLGPDFKSELFAQAQANLKERYSALHHGIELVETAGGLQFRTKPSRAALMRKLAKVQVQRLSSGAMQSLAIVAYRQPVMKEDIDKVRGVDSSYFIRGLLEKNLIEIAGRSDLPGRPMLYKTTEHFLEIFGLKDLSALPSLHEVEKMIPTSQSTNPDEEDPRVREMRKLVGQMTTDQSTLLHFNPREDEKILKEIRQRVAAIPTSTPYLEEQKALEKQAEAALESMELGQQIEMSTETAPPLSPEQNLEQALELAQEEPQEVASQDQGQDTTQLPPIDPAFTAEPAADPAQNPGV